MLDMGGLSESSLCPAVDKISLCSNPGHMDGEVLSKCVPNSRGISGDTDVRRGKERGTEARAFGAEEGHVTCT